MKYICKVVSIQQSGGSIVCVHMSIQLNLDNTDNNGNEDATVHTLLYLGILGTYSGNQNMIKPMPSPLHIVTSVRQMKFTLLQSYIKFCL